LTSGAAGATSTLGPSSYAPCGTVYQYGMTSGVPFNKFKNNFKYRGLYHTKIHAIYEPLAGCVVVWEYLSSFHF
jgi:hypothetical protein